MHSKIIGVGIEKSLKLPDVRTYMAKRMKELTGKGYTKEKALEMIIFELNLSEVIAMSVENVTIEDCYGGGVLLGADLGGTAGALVGKIQGTQMGTLIGGAVGGETAKQACKKIIDIASKAIVKKTSEHLWTKTKNPSQKEIDTAYLTAVMTAADKSNYDPAKAIKNISSNNKNNTQKPPLFKLSAEKTNGIWSSYANDFDNTDRYKIFKTPEKRNLLQTNCSYKI